MASQFIAPLPGSHAVGRGETFSAKAKRTVPWPDESIAVSDYFTPPRHAVLDMHAAMVFPLFRSIEGEALVTVLQLRILVPKHLATFLALAILDVIRSLRAGQPEGCLETWHIIRGVCVSGLAASLTELGHIY
jgi:hypothetical protein